MSMMEFLTTPDWVKPASQGRAQSGYDNSSEQVTAIDSLTIPDVVAPNQSS